MVQTISRMYGTQKQAQQAYEELEQQDYKYLHIFPARPARKETGDGAEAASPSHSDIVASLTRAFVLKHDAATYADRILKGGSLVTVHAVFGTALKARNILDSHDPIDSGVPEPTFNAKAWDEAFPISSALQLPLLTRTKLPFESMWGIPSVTRGRMLISDCLGISLLSKSATPFSNLAVLPVLSELKTPLSSRLGIPLLTEK